MAEGLHFPAALYILLEKAGGIQGMLWQRRA